MVIYTKSWLAGLGHDQTNLWENIFLDWIEDNWTLADPPKYHAVTAKHGVLFGSDYYGQWDYVCSSIVGGKVGSGMSATRMSVGGRLDSNVVYITLVFSCRKYSAQQGDELAVQINNVSEFLEDLIDKNPKALQSEGIRFMNLESIYDGEVEIYGQQVYELKFVVKCLISRINLE